jgi:hypothetical protein
MSGPGFFPGLRSETWGTRTLPVECLASHPSRKERGMDGAPNIDRHGLDGRLSAWLPTHPAKNAGWMGHPILIDMGSIARKSKEH